MLQSLTYRPCPVCEAPDATRLDAYCREDWQVASCDSCDFVHLRNPPDYTELTEDFAWEKTYEAGRKTSKGSTPLAPLSRWVRDTFKTNRDRSGKYIGWFGGGNILDIGCGNGTRIPEPFTPHGIELSNRLHALAQDAMSARGGYCAHGAGAEAIWDFPEDHFDGIIMHSYLEHEVQIDAVLTGCVQALKSKGKIFVRVPNFASLNRRVIGAKWCGFRYPDHVNYFTPASLRRVAAKHGMEVKITNPVTLPVDDNINALFSFTS
jgi:2-polyprenyl-3-methyl-5-hydroxy-6-metoxy-1,4-benzoquinol methylase